MEGWLQAVGFLPKKPKKFLVLTGTGKLGTMGDVFRVVRDSVPQNDACDARVWLTADTPARSEALALVFLLGKDFQGSKLKVSLTRKKGTMNSMRGGMPPREQRGMPPPLRGGNSSSPSPRGAASSSLARSCP